MCWAGQVGWTGQAKEEAGVASSDPAVATPPARRRNTARPLPPCSKPTIAKVKREGEGRAKSFLLAAAPERKDMKSAFGAVFSVLAVLAFII